MAKVATHKIPMDKETAKALLGLINAGRSISSEIFNDPQVLDVVLAARHVHANKPDTQSWSKEDISAVILYIMIKHLEIGYNETVCTAAKAVAESEKLESLKAYFDVAESLRAASKSQENPISGQYHFAALYVVVEGFIQLHMTDPKITQLCKSPNIRVLKKLRDSVFHYQPRRLNNKMLSFLTQECVNWAVELRTELRRWLDDNVKKSPQLTAAQTLEQFQKLLPEAQAAELIAAASSAPVPSQDQGTPQSIQAAPSLDLRSVFERVFDGKRENLWPMLHGLTHAVRKLNADLRPIVSDRISWHHAAASRRRRQ